MLNDRYGDLLDKGIAKVNKQNDEMLNAVEGISDYLTEQRRKEELRHKDFISKMDEIKRSEHERLQRNCDLVESMLEKARAKENEKQRIKLAEREEQERRERRRKTMENLNWSPGR